MTSCPQCGESFAGLSAQGLCPECLKRVALREGAEFEQSEASAVNDLLPESAQRKPIGTVNSSGPTGERWGDYELLETI